MLLMGWMQLSLIHDNNLPHGYTVLLPYLPYILLIAGLGIAWMFSTAREFNFLLMIAIVYWALEHYFWLMPKGFNRSLFSVGVLLLVPINIGLHYLLKERGILSWHGGLRTLVFPLLLGLLIWACQSHPAALAEFIYYKPAWIHWSFNSHLPFPVLFAIGVTGMALLVHWLHSHRLLVAGNLMALIALTLTFYNIKDWQDSILFLSTASFAILLALLLNSYGLAFLDELTGLPTRRALKLQLMSLGRRYSIVMVDIDHFKKLNDTYGHDVGDQVLRMVAAQLRKVTGGGKAFRYGGEEFTLLFSGKNSHEAASHADKLRELIADTPFTLRGHKRPKQKPEKPLSSKERPSVSVTVSMGVAEKGPDHETPMDVMKSADEFLYQAKHAGRNRVRYPR